MPKLKVPAALAAPKSRNDGARRRRVEDIVGDNVVVGQVALVGTAAEIVASVCFAVGAAPLAGAQPDSVAGRPQPG